MRKMLSMVLSIAVINSSTTANAITVEEVLMQINTRSGEHAAANKLILDVGQSLPIQIGEMCTRAGVSDLKLKNILTQTLPGSLGQIELDYLRIDGSAFNLFPNIFHGNNLIDEIRLKNNSAVLRFPDNFVMPGLTEFRILKSVGIVLPDNMKVMFPNLNRILISDTPVDDSINKIVSLFDLDELSVDKQAFDLMNRITVEFLIKRITETQGGEDPFSMYVSNRNLDGRQDGNEVTIRMLNDKLIEISKKVGEKTKSAGFR